MKRVRRYMALARRRRETKNIAQLVALPVAGFIAIVCVQLAILSANGALNLSAAAPIIWQTICFTGLLAVFMTMHQQR
jgi:L-serine deaminase